MQRCDACVTFMTGTHKGTFQIDIDQFCSDSVTEAREVFVLGRCECGLSPFAMPGVNFGWSWK